MTKQRRILKLQRKFTPLYLRHYSAREPYYGCSATADGERERPPHPIHDMFSLTDWARNQYCQLYEFSTCVMRTSVCIEMPTSEIRALPAAVADSMKSLVAARRSGLSNDEND